VARKCVREALVLLKNGNSLLPLAKSYKRILVAGSHANDIGRQCGGWTISWQGQSGSITPGTTILQGIQNAVNNDEVAYSLTGDFVNTSADYSIVVVGEPPYAEGTGDRTDLTLAPADVSLISKMKSYGNPVVVILVSGRPMIITGILNTADAIIAAWLPGTEGDGVADVLFGDFAPRGVLSHSWPKSMADVPVNLGDAVYDPLYPYGFGLTFTATGVGQSKGVVPDEFSLQQNFPNPFNPTTVVSYQLPVASNVRLAICDVLGREVAVIVRERREAGIHEVKFDAAGLASGVYLCRLQVGDFTATKKMLVLK
jgi:beta-glucosidase